MPSSSGSVEDKTRNLPPELQEEAVHYIDELVKLKKNPRKRSSTWAGLVAFPISIKV
jgi:hypothetical protein